MTPTRLTCVLAEVRRSQPIGNEMWSGVAERVSQVTGRKRDAESVKRKFDKLANEKPSTGDPDCPPLVRAAKRIAMEISNQNGVVNVGNSTRQPAAGHLRPTCMESPITSLSKAQASIPDALYLARQHTSPSVDDVGVGTQPQQQIQPTPQPQGKQSQQLVPKAKTTKPPVPQPTSRQPKQINPQAPQLKK